MSGLREAFRSVLAGTVLQLNILLPITRGYRYVFTYHDISEASSAHHHPVYSTPPATFQNHVDQLSRLFRLVSLSDLVDAPPDDGRHLAAIVFDDGFASVLEHAQPLLSSRGIPFALFVNRQAIEEDRLWCSDVVLGGADRCYLAQLYERYIDPNLADFETFVRDPLDHLVVSSRLADDYCAFHARPRPEGRTYLNRTQVLALARTGVTIGSHTSTHRVLARCSDEALREEIDGNCAYLSNLLDESVDHFAFPFGFEGMLDQRSVSLARSRHSHLYSTQRRSFRNARGSSPLLIPRIGFRSETAGELMASINLPFLSQQPLGFPGIRPTDLPTPEAKI